MTSRAYKTLPSAFKRDSRLPRSGSRSGSSPSASSSEPGLFSGLELKLGLSNLISNGMNLIGQLRNKKTPSASNPASESSSEPSSISSSAAFWECKSQLSEQAQELSTATSANVSELIEMTSFKTVAEGDLELQTGKGHDFTGIHSFNPIWCDQCRDLIWGLYDTGAMKCANCNLTCHDKCKSKVQLNCTAFERPKSQSSSNSSSSGSENNLSTLAGISTIIDEEGFLQNEEDDEEGTLKSVDLLAAFTDSTADDVSSLKTDDETLVQDVILDESLVASDELQSAIMLYNDGFPAGQETILENGKYTFFRVTNI